MSTQPAKNSNAESVAANAVVEHFGLIKYLTIALVIFVALVAINSYFVVEMDKYGKYLELLTSLAAKCLNLIGEDAVPYWNSSNFMTDIHVQADGAYISVTQDSDASTLYAMILATILPWPGKIWQRVVAAAAGAVLIFVFNILRIVAMMLVDLHIPVHFELMATWVLPFALAAVALLYFLCWTRLSGTHPSGR